MGWFFKKKEEPKLLLRRDLIDRAMEETQKVGNASPDWFQDPLSVREFEKELLPLFKRANIPLPQDEFSKMVFGNMLRTASVAMEWAGGTRTDQVRFVFFYLKMFYEHNGRSWLAG